MKDYSTYQLAQWVGAICCAVLLTACQQRTEEGTASSSGTSGMESTQSGRAASTDTAITAKVKAALLADSKVKSTDIHVETENGEVILSGFVDTSTQISEAVKIVNGVEGVKKVSNKIQARNPG